MGRLDAPAASPSPSGIHQLLRDPRQIPAPLTHDVAEWLPGDHVRQGSKDSWPVDGLRRADHQQRRQCRQWGRAVKAAWEPGAELKCRKANEKVGARVINKHGGVTMVQERVEDPRLEKPKPSKSSPSCLSCRSGSFGCSPGSWLSLSAPSKFSFVAAGAELKVTPLGSSPALPLTWGNISLFPSLGCFLICETGRRQSPGVFAVPGF